jgi:hypothetical protein
LVLAKKSTLIAPWMRRWRRGLRMPPVAAGESASMITIRVLVEVRPVGSEAV